MRAITRIILVLITLAILLLPFYLLVRYMSRKYVKQETGDLYDEILERDCGEDNYLKENL